MRIHRPPDRFGLPPNYRWIHGQPPDPPPDIPLGSNKVTPKESFGGYLSGYSNLPYPKPHGFTHDFSSKVVESCRYPLLFRKPTYYFN